jgi:DUF1680 family protein
LSFDLGRVALQRGPFTYCVEEADVGCYVDRLTIDDTAATMGASYEPDLLGGAVTLQVPAWWVRDTGWGDALYRDVTPSFSPITVRAIPYPLWAHRGAGGMAV